MTTEDLRKLLEGYRENRVSERDAIKALQRQSFTDLGFAKVDTQRELRKGFPEVVFGSGKTPAQAVAIAAELVDAGQRVLLTRVSEEHFKALKKRFKNAKHHDEARCVAIEDKPLPKRDGVIAVLSAGTSDQPVAEEAAVTAEFMGNRVNRLYDVGVAGLHRLLARLDELQNANVIVVVAGMEGALPSVVAGLVDRPVIAVPTSVGYGASFGGVAALLGMLNSCGSGVTVVNIDNGFGGGYAASQINSLCAPTNATPTKSSISKHK